jgi:phosphoribosylamine---glycine ligase
LKILIVGGGGREHALAWSCSRSPSVSQIVASPGNPGIAEIATCVPAPTAVSGYAEIAEQYGIDLTVVGPEAPLVAGIVDHFLGRGLKIIGPTEAAARLEGSKIFAKQFCLRANIPSARSVEVTSHVEARDSVGRFSFPLVIKADGLAAGKGVTIVRDRAEAFFAMEQLGPKLVIEEFLEGEEISFIALSKGTSIWPFVPTQDHKRAFDDDQGPNTGGMGAYSDARIVTSKQSEEIMERIMLPALRQMKLEGTPYMGFLYAGLMMTAEGPKVLEFNARLGDPEAQVLLHSLTSDLAESLCAVASDEKPKPLFSFGSPSVCVVLACQGYPDKPVTGQPITGTEAAKSLGAEVFHAGTKRKDGELLTSGGRVLGVTAAGASLPAAVANAYRAVEKIHFEGMHFRRDIAQKGLRRW